jgi:protein gp37
MENSKVEWTHHTFNPWRGCTKVSAGCANCYAETLSGRNPKVLGVWGPNGTRVVAAEAQWREPLKWDKEAARLGVRHRVFCASLADVFEGPETMPEVAREPVAAARRRLFKLIGQTPHLDWLLLTKRPQNVLKLTREAIDPDGEPDGNECCEPNGLDVATFAELYPNVWLGTSVENQAAADDRIPHLLKASAAVRFLSCEPLLGPVDLRRANVRDKGTYDKYDDYLTGKYWQQPGSWPGEYTEDMADRPQLLLSNPSHKVDWVIVGGESGPGARPFNVEWARSLVQQCKAAEVPVFVKQMGERPVRADGRPLGAYDAAEGAFPRCSRCGHFDFGPCGDGTLLCNGCDSPWGGLRDKKGGDPDEWPADLRVREFPQVKAVTA